MRKALSIAAVGAMGLGMLAMSAGTAFAAAATTYGPSTLTCPGGSATYSPMDGAGVQSAAATVACVSATETLRPGTLFFNNVDPVAFNGVQLSGIDQVDTTPVAQTIQLTDATGSDAGWNISLAAPNLILGGVVTDHGVQDNLPFANLVSVATLAPQAGNTTSPNGWSAAADLGLSAASQVICLTSDANGAWNLPSLEYNQPINANNTQGSYSAVWTYTLSPSTPDIVSTGVATTHSNQTASGLPVIP